jgi:peptidoglycan/xylan/chitin deacetylase (PgdA/CDA1 family)
LKVVISHDVDHFETKEHLHDLFVPKYMCRSALEALFGRISMRAVWRRTLDVATNRIGHLEALLDFNRENGVPATVFVATENGRGIRYGVDAAKKIVELATSMSMDVGLHAIAFEEAAAIRTELDRLGGLTGRRRHGLRVHDIGPGLRDIQLTGTHLLPLAASGAAFSSSSFGPGRPIRVGGFWEFPILLMDSDVFTKKGRLQAIGFAAARRETEEILEEAIEREDEFVSILFHDVYFSGGFPDHLAWYKWLIAHLRSRGIALVSYQEAVGSLDSAEAVLAGSIG